MLYTVLYICICNHVLNLNVFKKSLVFYANLTLLICTTFLWLTLALNGLHACLRFNLTPFAANFVWYQCITLLALETSIRALHIYDVQLNYIWCSSQLATMYDDSNQVVSHFIGVCFHPQLLPLGFEGQGLGVRWRGRGRGRGKTEKCDSPLSWGSPDAYGPGLLRASPSGEDQRTPHHTVPDSPQCPQEIGVTTLPVFQDAAVSSERFSQSLPPGNVVKLWSWEPRHPFRCL